jgi:hypothetical protein
MPHLRPFLFRNYVTNQIQAQGMSPRRMFPLPTSVLEVKRRTSPRGNKDEHDTRLPAQQFLVVHLRSSHTRAYVS